MIKVLIILEDLMASPVSVENRYFFGILSQKPGGLSRGSTNTHWALVPDTVSTNAVNALMRGMKPRSLASASGVSRVKNRMLSGIRTLLCMSRHS